MDFGGGFVTAQVGVVTFKGEQQYTDAALFTADSHLHCVPEGSPFGWRPGVTQMLYGWLVADVEWLPEPVPVPCMARHMRSLFKITQPLPDA
jgi:hypothetical protein